MENQLSVVEVSINNLDSQCQYYKIFIKEITYHQHLKATILGLIYFILPQKMLIILISNTNKLMPPLSPPPPLPLKMI